MVHATRALLSLFYRLACLGIATCAYAARAGAASRVSGSCSGPRAKASSLACDALHALFVSSSAVCCWKGHSAVGSGVWELILPRCASNSRLCAQIIDWLLLELGAEDRVERVELDSACAIFRSMPFRLNELTSRCCNSLQCPRANTKSPATWRCIPSDKSLRCAARTGKFFF